VPTHRGVAQRNLELVLSFRATLPDLHADDMIGSPYCVSGYELEPRFGGPKALGTARASLARRGIGLILDYVPNHVAPDHPWTSEHADYFIRGTSAELEANPEAFLQTAAGVLANGKDPYFTPWPDVVQLNAFSPGLREAVIATLASIGEQCDGVRCDMAMLMTSEVFARTWGERAGLPPADDYWPVIIAAVRETHPDLVFIAEAYWDMEWTLQQQGFDFCYDKRLYDRLVSESAQSVRDHLRAADDYQERLVRFIENHDEPRAADTFTPEKERAAAVVMSTLEGARLYHNGQLAGLHTHIPMFLDRGPNNPETNSYARSTTDCLARSPTPICATVTGSYVSAPAGPITTAPSNSSPGAGGRTDSDTWSSSTSPRRTHKCRCASLGAIWRDAPGSCTTRSAVRRSSATATSSKTTGCTSQCGRGSRTSSRSPPDRPVSRLREPRGRLRRVRQVLSQVLGCGCDGRAVRRAQRDRQQRRHDQVEGDS
jgi:Alpha amylase, catalytic domain